MKVTSYPEPKSDGFSFSPENLERAQTICARYPEGRQGSATIAPGESTTLEFAVDLPPGEYPYWCAVGNHREMGMEGTMVVTA